jgi:glycosyltransferase involved in cell wall biosynthesis
MPQYIIKAKVSLMPIKWEEPFGLTFIESMACGTPVIAFNRGSAKEVIKNKKTGFIVKNIKEMAGAIKKIDQIKRKDCRDWVKEKFTIEKMVQDYEQIFYKMLSGSQKVKKSSR